MAKYGQRGVAQSEALQDPHGCKHHFLRFKNFIQPLVEVVFNFHSLVPAALLYSDHLRCILLVWSRHLGLSCLPLHHRYTDKPKLIL